VLLPQRQLRPEAVTAVLLSLAVGLLAGFLITYLLLRRSSISLAEGQFQASQASELRRIRHEELDTRRGDLKRQIGDDLGVEAESFPFEAADARFIGHPVHYVVFDGHTEIKDRSLDSLRGVIFVSLRSDQSPAFESQLVEECVAAGRLRWMTMPIPFA
jgi:predicted Holliday junction resolvase-like endonuclease